MLLFLATLLCIYRGCLFFLSIIIRMIPWIFVLLIPFGVAAFGWE